MTVKVFKSQITITLLVFSPTKRRNMMKNLKALPGREVSEKVSAVGFCLGSGLFGSCISN